MTYLILAMAIMRLATQAFTTIRLKKFMRTKVDLEDRENWPPISIIMPMKGVSDNSFETLEALLGQDYAGDVELVIAIEDAQDPAVKLVEEYQKKENGKVHIRLLRGLERIGLNPKSSNVMHCIQNATYDWLYFNDADSRPPVYHLRHMMTLVKDRSDHFVSALSVHHGGKNPFGVAENVSSNVEIATYYMLAGPETCPVNGGAYFLHKDMLAKIGGYKIALNTVTEDLMFSNELKKAGATCHKSRSVVKTGGEFQNLSGYLKRQVRWLLIAKCYKPELFYLALLNMPSIWSFLWGAIIQDYRFIVLGVLLLILRVIQSFYHQRILGTPSVDWSKAWGMIIYDLLLPYVWFKTLITREVNWGGNIMHVRSGGKLTVK